MSALLIGLFIVASSPQGLTTPQEPSTATFDPWSTLDEELALWSEEAEQEIDPATVSGFIQTSFLHSVLQGDGGSAGFLVDRARLVLSGNSVDDYSYRVSGDFAARSKSTIDDGSGDETEYNDGFGSFDLRDAYIRLPIPGPFKVTAGNFKMPILRSSRIEADQLLLPTRTHAATKLAERDLGLMVEGHWGILRGYLSIHNGSDGQGDDMMVGTRLEVDVAGKGVSMVEGALGAPAELAITLGAAAFEDSSIDEDGRILAVDLALTYDRLAISAEVVDFGDGFGGSYGADAMSPRGALGSLTDTRPRSFTISYMAQPEVYELLWRIDYLDQGAGSDRNMQTFGVNRYIEGHDLKWQFGIIVDEMDGEDDHFITAGLMASF